MNIHLSVSILFVNFPSWLSWLMFECEFTRGWKQEYFLSWDCLRIVRIHCWNHILLITVWQCLHNIYGAVQPTPVFTSNSSCTLKTSFTRGWKQEYFLSWDCLRIVRMRCWNHILLITVWQCLHNIYGAVQPTPVFTSNSSCMLKTSFDGRGSRLSMFAY